MLQKAVYVGDKVGLGLDHLLQVFQCDVSALFQVVWKRVLERPLVRSLGSFENPAVDTHLLLTKVGVLTRERSLNF